MTDYLNEKLKNISNRRDNSADLSAFHNNGVEERMVRIDIFIAKHCFACEYSHEVAAFIRKRFPEVQIQLIDIADPEAEIPDSVFATPTYLLNGCLWSLGNPSNEDVVEKLSTALKM